MSIGALLVYKVYSFFWGLWYLPFKQALHIPVLIHPSVKVQQLSRGAISFVGPLRHSMFIFGFEGTLGQSNCRSILSIKNGGRLIVGNTVSMARGTRLIINGGVMKVGNHFWCNGDGFFNCTTKITIGDDNMYGWNVSFNTSDGHHVCENGQQKEMEGEIEIGNHVWIASYCIVGKNAFVADDCVVAQRSLVNKRFDSVESLIGGMPANIIKKNYFWKV